MSYNPVQKGIGQSLPLSITMQLAKFVISSLFCCAIASASYTNKCWQVPDTNCEQDSRISGWFPRIVNPTIDSGTIIRQCIEMQTCSNSTHFSSRKECEKKCVIKCPEPIPNPPYQPNTLVSNKELHEDGGVTYTSLSTCGEGYILIGSHKRRCKSDGNWTGEKPICREIRISVRRNKQIKPDKLDSTNILMAEEGQQLLISCSVEEKFPMMDENMVWRKVKGQATHRLPPMHDMREIKDNMNNIFIQIDHASSVHSGTYSCMSLSNPILSRNFTIRVKDPKKSPKIMSATMKLDRNTLRLKCHAKGSPAPEVNWFRDYVLVEGKNNTLSAREDTLLDLTITNPGCAHIGKYACRAKNEHGIIEHTVESLTAEDLGVPNAGSGSGDGCRESCKLCPRSKAPVMKTCNVSDTVIIARLMVNNTSVHSNTFMINESKVLKGSNSTHLNLLKLTEGATACDCLTVKPQLWYICTGTRNKDMLIVSQNDMVYAATDQQGDKVKKHCKLMKN